jgi:predicted HAD superfamily hydrolase
MGFYWDVKNTVGVLTKKERIWRVKQNISNFVNFLKNNLLLTTIWAVAVSVIVFFHFFNLKLLILFKNSIPILIF